MADIELKYLTELASATSISDDDLFHINQEGNDKSIAASVIKKFIVDSMYPANSGAVAFLQNTSIQIRSFRAPFGLEFLAWENNTPCK